MQRDIPRVPAVHAIILRKLQKIIISAKAVT